jgi:O-antigen/teichoic acid export membrane protein
MIYKLNSIYLFVKHSGLAKNSFWGFAGRIAETLFLSLFFVILSRNFTTPNFAYFLIASNIYQLSVGFSSMGLGDWFIRELNHEPDKKSLINKFFKIQFGLGFLFYFLNVLLSVILYKDANIYFISMILGINIIFDNIIYSIKSLNIAESQQKKTAVIMAIDGFCKLMIGCLLFIYPFSIIILSVLLVLVRFLTVNLFINIGASFKIDLVSLWRTKISKFDIKRQIFSNWRFVVIVGLSLILWRSATIIISKFLTLNDVANYEVAYKVFSVFMIFPIIASTTIYPQFVKYFANKNHEIIKAFYRKVFAGYAIISVICYAFIQSFAPEIIHVIFGSKYTQSANCLKEMFLTFLVFPTALLQANLLVAMKLEKLDMYFNLIMVGIFFIGSFVALKYFSTLSVINYAILSAFLALHFLQSIFLNKLKIASLKQNCIFYFSTLIFVSLYSYGINASNPTIAFVVLICLVVLALFFIIRNKSLRHSDGIAIPT